MANGENVIFTNENSLYSRVAPTEEQLEKLKSAWNELADFLVKHVREKYGYSSRTWIQGSYKFKTLIQPVVKDEEYDIDLGFYFTKQEVSDKSASDLRDLINEALDVFKTQCADVKKVEEPKTRCCRLTYLDSFHIDVPVYILDADKDERTLAVLPDDWETSDPKAIYVWFKDTVPEEYRKEVRRLIYYLKGWSAVNFSHPAKPKLSSITLTVLAAQFYSLNPTKFSEGNDEERLINLAIWMKAKLGSTFNVPNPVYPTENLCRFEQADKPFIEEKLRILSQAALDAQNADSEAGAAVAWQQAFGYLIDLPADVDALVQGEKETFKSQLTIPHTQSKTPRIKITVWSKDKKQVESTHYDSVAGVPKDRYLTFSIENSHELPAGARAIWTVRNKGSDAASVFDHGHVKGPLQIHEQVEEHTEYVGAHFMDCAIVLNGAINSIVRVPVSIGNKFQHLMRDTFERKQRVKPFRGRI